MTEVKLSALRIDVTLLETARRSRPVPKKHLWQKSPYMRLKLTERLAPASLTARKSQVILEEAEMSSSALGLKGSYLANL